MTRLNFSNLSAAGSSTLAQADAYGLRIGAALTEQASSMPHEFAERLRAARVRAVAERKRPVGQFAPQTQTQIQASGGVGVLKGLWAGFEDHAFFRAIGLFFPILALVACFWLMSAESADERVAEIAAVDAAILQDDVPPAAYADPGFAQFIRDNR